MILVNGQLTDRLPVTDRGLQYGDGLYETMLAVHQRIPLWRFHLKRLLQGCKRLSISPPETALLEAEVRSLLTNNASPVIVKLIVTRGSGGRGYLATTDMISTRILSLHPKTSYPKAFAENGISLFLCETRLGLNPGLAGIKHLNRLEQVLARSEWQDDTCAEGLMLDNLGHPVEGTSSNIFWISKGELYTPSLQNCGIDGIMRQQVIGVAEELGVSVNISQYSVDDILAAEGLFVCNSVNGIWPVRNFRSCEWQPHQLMKKIQEKVALLVC